MKSLVRMMVALLLFGGAVLVPMRLANAQTEPKHAANEAGAPEGSKSEEDENDIYRKSPMVRKMGAMAGMNAAQSATAFEVTNFAVLAILVGWFLAKALPKAFRDRNTAIQKHLVDARTATEEANLRLGGVEARLAKLDEQIAGMKAQAEKDAAADERRIQASVAEETKKILDAAEQEIAAAAVQARRELQRYAAELAVEQAGRKLTVTAETDRLLIQGFARRLAGDGTRGAN